MRDRDDGARVIAQVLFQPCDRLGIQVVGGLVEQQQVGLSQQSRHRATRRRSPPESLVTSASAGGQRSASMAILKRGVEVPAVHGVDVLLYPRELVGRLVGVVHRELVEAVQQRADLGDAILDVALDVLGLVEMGSCSRMPTVALGASWAWPSNSVSTRP